MAKRETINLIIKTFKELGGNLSDVLGTRTNISFLGVGDNIEPFLDKNLNTQALGALSQSKAVDEVKNSVGFAVGEKLNDIQANNLLTNLNKMKEFYMPTPVTNITDLATGTRNLDAEGIASLRTTQELEKNKPVFDKAMQSAAKESEAMRNAGLDPSNLDDYNKAEKMGIIKPRGDYMTDEGVMASETILPMRSLDDIVKNPRKFENEASFPGETFAATSKEQADIIKQLKIKDPDLANQIGKTDKTMNIKDVVTMQGKGGMDFIDFVRRTDPEGAAKLQKEVDRLNKASDAADARLAIANMPNAPIKRANAREFLVEALKRDTMDINSPGFGRTNLNDFISGEDVKFITEGGGGIMGDPLILVEKYFGPRILELIPDERMTPKFINRLLTNIRDATGKSPDDPGFDRFTATLIGEEIPFAKGGLAKILEV